MSITQILEALKNMAGDGLAQAQNAVLMSADVAEDDRTAADALIGLLSVELGD